jgi:hypothetical protein
MKGEWGGIIRFCAYVAGQFGTSDSLPSSYVYFETPLKIFISAQNVVFNIVFTT